MSPQQTERITVHFLSTGTSRIPGRKRSSSQPKPLFCSSRYWKRLYHAGEGVKRDAREVWMKRGGMPS
jgi:hypothetical protein